MKPKRRRHAEQAVGWGKQEEAMDLILKGMRRQNKAISMLNDEIKGNKPSASPNTTKPKAGVPQ